jgi:hypothetical protein
MSRDAQGNLIITNRDQQNMVDQINRNAVFNMVSNICESMARSNNLISNWMQGRMEVPQDCYSQAMKTWWDSLCGEYSRQKQQNYAVSSNRMV